MLQTLICWPSYMCKPAMYFQQGLCPGGITPRAYGLASCRPQDAIQSELHKDRPSRVCMAGRPLCRGLSPEGEPCQCTRAWYAWRTGPQNSGSPWKTTSGRRALMCIPLCHFSDGALRACLSPPAQTQKPPQAGEHEACVSCHSAHAVPAQGCSQYATTCCSSLAQAAVLPQQRLMY